MRRRVHVSFSRSDLPGVAALAADLQALGQDVWLDRELPGGDIWWERQLSNLNRCDAFIVVLSGDVMDSAICKSELAAAQSAGVPIIPVLVEDGLVDAFLPPSLGHVQRVDYRQSDRLAMAELAKALRSSVSTSRRPDASIYPPVVPDGREPGL